MSQYERLLNADLRTTKLITHSVLLPSFLEEFGSVLIASACFRETMLYQLWSRRRVEFRESRKLAKTLRYRTHLNGEKIAIHYVTEHAWSKSAQLKSFSGGTVLDHVCERVRTHFGSAAFLWMANKSVESNPFAGHSAMRLPNSPHGLNEYQNVHNVVVLSALNPTPAHFGFLESQGLTHDEVQTAQHRTAVYQAVMRSSARNPLDCSPKTFVVMDKSTADWLAVRFPGAQVTPLPGGDPLEFNKKRGRPKVPNDASARRIAHARAQADRITAELTQLRADLSLSEQPFSVLVGAEDELFGLSARWNENANNTYRNSVTTTHGMAFRSIFDAVGIGCVETKSEFEFVRFLREMHGRPLTSKESGGLFSPAVFDAAANEETSRGLANIRYVRGIWLDNDGGDLSYAEFAKVFPALALLCLEHLLAHPRQAKMARLYPDNLRYDGGGASLVDEADRVRAQQCWVLVEVRSEKEAPY